MFFLYVLLCQSIAHFESCTHLNFYFLWAFRCWCRILLVMNEQDQNTTPQPLVTPPDTAFTQFATPQVTQTAVAEQTKPTPEQPEKMGIGSALANIGILLMAPLLAVLLLVFVFQSYRVDGQSMEKTLQNDDRLIVWKLPRTLSKITGNDYIPNRGDVIILKESGLSTYGDNQNTKQLVKRVIALPGERIVIKDGKVTVYNTEHPNGFNPDTTLPYGKDTDLSFTPNDVDFTLGDTQLFVCGDNRTNSLDSRAFGPIESDQVVGKLVARILPLSKAKAF